MSAGTSCKSCSHSVQSHQELTSMETCLAICRRVSICCRLASISHRLGVGMSDAANTRVCATASNAGCRISAWRTHSCVPRPHSCGRLCLKCDEKSRLGTIRIPESSDLNARLADLIASILAQGLGGAGCEAPRHSATSGAHAQVRPALFLFCATKLV